MSTYYPFLVSALISVVGWLCASYPRLLRQQRGPLLMRKALVTATTIEVVLWQSDGTEQGRLKDGVGLSRMPNDGAFLEIVVLLCRT